MHRRRSPLLLVAALLSGCGGSGQHAPGATTRAAPVVDRGTAVVGGGRLPPARGDHHGPVPILMYHVIGRPPPGAPYPGLSVSPGLFTRQVRSLARAGFRAVTLEQARAAWHGGPGLPADAVVLSFDDGYQGQATHAAPVMRALGWPGVLNLEVHDLHVAGGLNRSEVHAMLGDGWELAAHTLTHPDLTAVGAQRLRHEVAGSRAVLRREFGVRVDFFCYPAGRYDAAVEGVVRAAGYRGATTEDPGIAGPGSDPYALPRIRVLGGESPSAVVAAARGG